MSELSAKDFLRLVRMARGRASPEMERLENLRERAGYGTGQKEAQRISGTSQRSRVEDNVCTLVDLEREIEGRKLKERVTAMRYGTPKEASAELIDYAALRYEAETVIRMIPREMFRDVLREYYIERKEWHEVASVIKRSVRHTKRIHGGALEVFERLWRNYRSP